jgi:hypothetical protein
MSETEVCLSRSVEINSVETREAADAVASTKIVERKGTATRAGVIVALCAFVVLGLGLRLSGISALGFAEDEVNKIDAVGAYERGDIRPNAEHPMLMKSLMYLSMQAARAWQNTGGKAISDEAALRFPNILFGALTAIPIYLLMACFFDRRTGLVAAALWAFGVNAITHNRIAKEDTLLVFFMLSAFYLFIRAKQTSGFEQKSKRRYYALSAASFGLMLASKYFPHYFGLNMLFHHWFHVREREPHEPAGHTPLFFFVIVVTVFLVANPAVLLPQTWAYLSAYTSGSLLTHTGYLMGEHLYKNNMSSTPFWGTPIYFYLLFLLVKVPLPVLFAFIVGLTECARRPKLPGHTFLLFMFLFWIVPYSLIGAKWLRYTLSLMPFVYMIAAVGVMVMVRLCASLLKGVRLERLTIPASLALILFFTALPARTAYASRPHYALYTNALGDNRVGYYFPHDEFYDDGLREAIEFVCQHAPQGASLVHETPAVVRYYLEKYKRTDIKSLILSDAKLNLAEAPKPAYVIVQRGRIYFENRERVKEVREKFQKAHEVIVEGAPAVEVYLMK